MNAFMDAWMHTCMDAWSRKAGDHDWLWLWLEPNRDSTQSQLASGGATDPHNTRCVDAS